MSVNEPRLNKGYLWDDKTIQFARLLTVIEEKGIYDDLMAHICITSNLTGEQVRDILDRAKAHWAAAVTIWGDPNEVHSDVQGP